MLKFPKRIMALLLSLLLLIPGTAVTAFAEYDTGNGNVVQSGECPEEGCTFHWKLYENGLLYVDSNNADCNDYYDNHNICVEDSAVKKVLLGENIADIDHIYVNNDMRDDTDYEPDIFMRDFYLLESVEVSENNPYFYSVNGILYRYGSSIEDIKEGDIYYPGDTLLYCPRGYQNKTVEVNPGTKTIGAFAFNHVYNIETVKIPKTVTSILIGGFSFCNSIKSVIFEEGNGQKDLRIARKAFFYNSELNDIELTGSRIYSIDSEAFEGTAYADNKSNYENGVLYLNDILLSVDDLSIPDDYTVKDGTTTIADNSFLLRSLTGEHVKYRDGYKIIKECNKKVKAVNVTLPDSVTNIGVNSVHSFNNIPENIFRIGAPELFLASVLIPFVDNTDFGIENQEPADKAITEIKDILSNYNENCSIDDIKEMFKNNSEWVSIDINNQTINMFPVSCLYDVTPSICRLKEGTVGFADGYYFKYSPGCNSLLFGIENGFSKSTILPTSFNNLSKSTPLSWHQYDFNIERFYSEMFSYCIDYPNPFTEEKCVTFLNKDCCIFDDADTINKYVTICGYKGSTAEAYALKYNRNFVDISDCQHEKTCPNFTIEPTCGKDGYSGDVYCQYCGEFIKGGEVIPATGEHKFSSPERIKDPTCTEPGEEKVKCSKCGYTETREIEPNGHDFIITISHFDGTCTEDGYVVKMCIFCNETQKEITNIATGHADDNNDGYCDKCGEKLKTDCSCICHKDNAIARLFYKIFRILWKIFGTKKTCTCGVNHY